MHLRFLYILALFAFVSSVQSQSMVDSTLANYDRHWQISDGIYRVMLDSKIGVIDDAGTVIVPCEYNQVWNLDDKGFFRVLKQGKVGVYHQSGRIVIPPEYDQVWSFGSNGWAKVMKHGKLGFYDEEGNPVIPCEYQQIWSFEEGRARVLKNGKIGYVNNVGSEIIPCEYQQIWSFENGRARVLKDGKVGYIDEAGNEVVPPMYSHIWSFEEGKAKALLEGKMVWIDEQGQVLDIPIEQAVLDEKPKTETNITVGKEKHIIIEDKGGEKTHIRILGGEVIIEEQGSNTYIEMGPNRYRKERVSRNRRFRGHYTGLEFGFNAYVSPDGSTNLPPESSFMDIDQNKSHTFAFNFLQWSIGLQRRGNIGLVTGLGLEYGSYRFSGPYILKKDEAGNIDYDLSIRGISSNRLSTTYLNMPLLLEFQIPTNRNRHAFYVSAGAVGGVRLHSFTRVKYNDGESPEKVRSTSDYNLQDWRYGAMVRMGYRAINLYGTYYMTPLFKKDTGPELYPFSVGLSIAFNMWDLGG
ncbi:WG repeat-containing protein [Carboxylicivirga sp. N1Y90]|uniref:WG repeat-containing protein n=1 Tax=Carboxylicivirga fragile TaxID=3417571 RepID=UPI003D3385EC|nr:WG repeat-containing protein [Marinilabiliaceae bacterium N1Y90]